MSLGKLDRYITIQQFTTVANDYGEEIKTWTTYLSVWADRTEDTGGESITMDQVVAKIKVMFRVRYDSGINETMRILYDSDYYNIENIQEENRIDYLMLDLPFFVLFYQ